MFIFGRNLAFNFFPFVLRERHLLKQSLDSEISAVYQYARMIDVCDKNNNCQFISIDDIFYCCKNGNETEIYTEDGTKHTRYCTIKYLTQLFEDKDFIRISPSIIVPIKHIASCDGKEVVLKMMPWTETPLTFRLDTQKFPHVVDLIEEHLPADQVSIIFKQQVDENEDAKNISSVPPKEKLDAVYDYIKEFPGCRSTVLIAHTSYSKTTMDRILSELRKQGLVEFRGSKKKGGYYVVEGRDDR